MKKIFFTIIASFLFCYTTSLSGQVVDDNNVAVESSASTSQLVFANFTVPLGNNRLLVVSAWNSNLADSITFNGNKLIKAVTYPSLEANIWYLLLGSDVSITSDIIVHYSEMVSNAIAIANSFQNIDQTTPLGNQSAGGGAGNANGISITVSGTSPDNLIIDLVRVDKILSPGPGADQFLIGEGTAGNTMLFSSYERAAGVSDTYMSWSWPGVGFLQYSHVAKEFFYDGSGLSVELLEFFGRPLQQNIALGWSTSSEQNNWGFEIQRSKNGKAWQTIGFVEGKGTTGWLTEYQFIDSNPFQGMNYYRLQQIDFEGSYKFSKIIAVEIRGNNNMVNIFPTIAKDQLFIQFNEAPREIPVILIFDLMGKKMFEIKEQRTEIDLTNFFEGLYLISITYNNNTWTERFFKVK